MEKYKQMCFDVVFLYENIRTHVHLYFLHLVLTSPIAS